MENLILRSMLTDDAAEVVILCKKWFGKSTVARKGYLEDVAWSWRYESLVAELDGKIVACACAKLAEWFEDYYEAKKDIATIEVVAVDLDYHGRGVGFRYYEVPDRHGTGDYSAFMTRMTCRKNSPSEE